MIRKQTLIRYYISAVLFLCCFILASAQDTFIKRMNKGENRRAVQVEVFEERIFVLSAGICDNQFECSMIMEIDNQGKILWENTLKWLDIGPNSMIIDDDVIYLSGNHPSQKKWLWHHMSIDGGDSLRTYEIYDSTNIFDSMFNLGQVKFQDKFCIYGPGNQDGNESSLMYYVNKEGELDTLITPFTSSRDADPWEIITYKDEYLILFIRYEEFGQDPQRIVAKVTADKRLDWAYISEEYLLNDAVPRGTVLNDSLAVYNTRDGFQGSQNIRCINRDSTIYWVNENPQQIGLYKEYFGVMSLTDGNILGVGSWGDARSEPLVLDTPWLKKISSKGINMWERRFVYFGVDEEESSYGLFFDAAELADGSLVLVGTIDEGFSSPREILIARLDADGCLLGNCDAEVDITDVLSNTQNEYAIEVNIYPNPASQVLRVKSQDVPDMLEVYSVDGERLIKKDHSHQIDVSLLANGFYLLRIYMEDKRIHRSFLKINQL